MKQPPLKSPYLRPADAAKYMCVNRATLYRWMEAKKIKSYLIGGTRLFKISDLDALVESGEEK
jgi:excisionase family DNA binding protein